MYKYHHHFSPHLRYSGIPSWPLRPLLVGETVSIVPNPYVDRLKHPDGTSDEHPSRRRCARYNWYNLLECPVDPPNMDQLEIQKYGRSPGCYHVTVGLLCCPFWNLCRCSEFRNSHSNTTTRFLRLGHGQLDANSDLQQLVANLGSDLVLLGNYRIFRWTGGGSDLHS